MSGLITLYIVRHGNTFDPGDVVRRVGARTDLELSKSGHDQARNLASAFAGSNTCFSSIRSSPLKRTLQTAQIIMAAQPLPVPEIEIAPFLKEIDYGPDEGQTEDAVIERIGQSAIDLWECDMTPPKGWHVDMEAIERGWKTLFDTLKSQTGPHLCVTSNGIARFALRLAENGAAFTPKLKTGAMGIIGIFPSGTIKVLRWNEIPISNISE